ncbi:hypothetical protein Q3O43_28825 (plasmid) [Rhodococcus aetherivorans]|uniref:hypothetical protein n=1 Tax=Rhodococcus aetherivorans TaxID=191292 RepID=UPI0026F28036|nr:hypothetical protein [Rhodococcus aetherivorans]WKX01780.1 hypothetical protein Q3O43_28825 [Rhodococcus aetherivorans]
MKLLRVASILSVLCTGPILLYVVPPLLVLSGVVEVSGSVEYMVVLPTLIGLPCALTASIVGTACVLQRRTRTVASVLMTVGQLSTIVLGATIVVWALNFGTTGWELLALPFALIGGQILVAVGLFFRRRTASAVLQQP